MNASCISSHRAAFGVFAGVKSWLAAQLSLFSSGLELSGDSPITINDLLALLAVCHKVVKLLRITCPDSPSHMPGSVRPGEYSNLLSKDNAHILLPTNHFSSSFFFLTWDKIFVLAVGLLDKHTLKILFVLHFTDQ